MTRRFVSICGALVGLGALLAPSLPHAQQYPTRTITIVSPYGPGGNADLAARALANVASRYLGQSLVVLNKMGAGGMVGSQIVLAAPKDGYTLLLARVGSQVVLPALEPTTTPYKWDSFTILGMLQLDPYVCVVSSKSPLKTFQDLTEALKANPGKMNYASTGTADASVVFAVKIFLDLGLKSDAAQMIAYKGSGETISALLSGQVDFTCNGLSPYAGQIKSGVLRALVVSTQTRIPDAPDAPTAAEVGMPDLETVSGWSALYGPPGLPQDVKDRWVSVLSKIKDDPEWTKSVVNTGSVASVMSPEETTRFVQDQYKAYSSIASQMGTSQH